MPISLRDVAQSCLGKSTPLSMRWDVFGFYSNPELELSLRRQLELAQGEGLNLNLILVAEEDFTWADIEEIQFAVQYMRNIYDDEGICVRKIRWQVISAADAGGYATINSGSEAFDLTDDWNGPDGGYLDVFIVRNMTGGAGGWSTVDSPCSKDDKDEMTGTVNALNFSRETSGIIFAHEAGHYLGLNHHSNHGNFMHANASGGSTNITSAQGSTMRSHCYVRVVC
jgi:hypothetical protein